MAVRIFELTETQSSRFEEVQAPPRRRERRRLRQRYAIIGVLALAVPFVAAVVALGVAH